jgi:GT2 family glycosyltransferase
MVARYPGSDSPSSVDLSVVIPVFGERELLHRCLEAVERELVASGLGDVSEIVVVDDATPGGLGGDLTRRYPRVRRLVARRRRGFSVNANRGVDAARGGVVCLLNTDMVVLPGFFDACLTAFDDPHLFAVTGRILEPSGRNAGCKRLTMEGARAEVAERRAEDPLSMRCGPSPYANGGGSFFRRSAFLELRGFDRAFSPFYWEDADLGYRAWRRGHRILYDPTRAVAHDHQGTIGRLGARAVRRAYRRNRRRFIWHNNTSVGLGRLFRETNLRPVLRALRRLRVLRVTDLLAEARFLPRAAAARRSSRRDRVIDDSELARLWAGPPEEALDRRGEFGRDPR